MNVRRNPPRPTESVWTIHGVRSLYDSWWCGFELLDVELPSGRRFEHEAMRVPREAVGTAVVVDDALLMIWRHRMIPDSWGWEVPAGVVDPGEAVAVAARREVVEETGWDCGSTEALFSWHPSSGMSDQRFHLHRSFAATHVGDPSELDEAVEVAWVPLADLSDMVAAGEIVDGLTMVAVWRTLAGGSAG
jgi:8-oxo-dGTP pyrophosphatase MutT (NUDIX family)